MDRNRVANALLLLTVFLLPWQTRWIFASLVLNGEAWEYGVLSVYAVEVLVLAALLLRGRPTLPPVRKAIAGSAVFLAVCVFSGAFSENLALALNHLFHLSVASLLFWLLLDCRTNIRHMAVAFIVGLVAPALLGWYQVLTATSPASTVLGLAFHEAVTLGASVIETGGGRLLRAYGSFSHPNVFGGYVAVALLLLAWLSSQVRHVTHRRLLAIPLLILASTVVVTFSRSAMLAAAIGFVVLIALMLWQRKMPPSFALPLAALGLLSVLVTLIVFHEPAFVRVHPQLRLEARSLSERATEYRTFDNVFVRNSLTGVGPGNYTLALSAVRAGEPAWSYQPIHNSLLLIFTETGMLGFAAFIFWLTSIARPVAAAIRRGQGMFAAAIGAALLVLGTLDHYLWSSWSGLALMAVVFALMLRWTTDRTE